MAGRWRSACVTGALALLTAACSSAGGGRPVNVSALLGRASRTTAAPAAGDPAAGGGPVGASSGTGTVESGGPGGVAASGGAFPGGAVPGGATAAGSPAAGAAAAAQAGGPGPRADGPSPAASGARPSGAGGPAQAGAGAATPGTPGGNRPGNPGGPHPGGPAAPGPGAVPGGPVAIGPPSGKGFTPTTITIGLELLDENSAQGARLIGASSTDTGDTRKFATAVVDYVNSQGGLAGRKVTPVFHTTNVLAGSFDSHAQATCSDFAEDNKVFAAVASMYELSEVLGRCLAQHATPLTLDGRAVRDDAMLGELGDFLYMPSRMSATRWAGLTIDGLNDMGWFEPGAKVGLLRFDQPVQARIVSQVLRPRLARLKANVVAEEAVSYPDSINGFGATSAQLSSAVLRLRAAGVTHLIPVDDHGILCFLFMPQAESQGFRPRYGLSTNNEPFVIEDNMPAEQFKRAVGVGWIPADDVAFERNPGGNPTEDLCRSIFTRVGAQFPSRFAWSNALNYCDSMLFLKAALDRAPELSVAGLRRAVAGLAAGGFASAYTFRTAFTQDRHDGAAAYRWFRFADDCHCVRYDGPIRPMAGG